MSREHILKKGVYVAETGTRDEILKPGIFVSETVAVAATVSYAAFSTPQHDGLTVTTMLGY